MDTTTQTAEMPKTYREQLDTMEINVPLDIATSHDFRNLNATMYKDFHATDIKTGQPKSTKRFSIRRVKGTDRKQVWRIS